MKKPTLEEVKEYFKNAEIVSASGLTVKMYLNNIFYKDELYWLKFKSEDYLMWSYCTGYAKILTYKEPSFRPISMKCDKEQFESIRKKLNNSGVKTRNIHFSYPYLTNKYLEIDNLVSTSYKKEGREIHETWNEKVFLEACGIGSEEEETFVITKKDVNKLYDMAELQKLPIFKQEIKKMFPKAFEEEKKELPKDFTGWCKTQLDGYCKRICFFEEGILKYGFDVFGNWFRVSIKECNKVPSGEGYEATEQEVFEALSSEINKRYKKGDIIKSLRTNNEKKLTHDLIIDKNKFHNSNDFWISVDQWHNVCVFENGKWAEIIKTKQMTQSDIEKELGYKIEILK